MICVAAKYGELGNRLFVFANLIAFCIGSGAKLANPSFDEYAHLFVSTRGDPLCRFPPVEPRGLLRIVNHHFAFTVLNKIARLSKRAKLNNRFIRCVTLGANETVFSLEESTSVSLLKSAPLVFVEGWLFRSQSDLRKYSDEIKRYFMPVEVHRANVDMLIASARLGRDVLVGVHLRRGDYRTWQEGKYFYTDSEYRSLMSCVVSLFPNKRVRFLACSNEPIDIATFGDLDVRIGNNHHLEDMYAFARCDYLIGPPSTYTLWASYYGDVPLYIVENVAEPVTLDQFGHP